jgi:hypothetical protein
MVKSDTDNLLIHSDQTEEEVELSSSVSPKKRLTLSGRATKLISGMFGKVYVNSRISQF